MPEPILLDAAHGGRQRLRIALSLSLVTGRPLVVQGLGRADRAGLDEPMRACLRAAHAVGGGELEGAEVGSDGFRIAPGAVRPGRYLLDLGDEAPLPLVAQTLAVPLALAGGASKLTLRGATEPDRGPPSHYLSLVWAPAMREIGFEVAVELKAAAYGRAGGGELSLSVGAAASAHGLERRTRGTLQEVRLVTSLSKVPLERAAAEAEAATSRLRARGVAAEAERLPVPSPRSKGCTIVLLASFERARLGFAARANPEAEGTAGEAVAAAFLSFLEGGAAIAPQLADQLLVPLSAAAAGLQGGQRPVSRFTTAPATAALSEGAEVVGRFLDVEIAILPASSGEDTEVRIAPLSEGLLQRVAAARRG